MSATIVGASTTAAEAYRQHIEDQYLTVYQYPSHLIPDGAQEVWIRPDGSVNWQPLGFTSDVVLGIDYGAADPAGSAVLAWPYQYGKSAAVSLTAQVTSSMRAMFDALFVDHRARLDRRLRRLADDLGRWEPHVHRDFHTVQQILEDAGIGDGYGRLTIAQPVRPPVELPHAPGLITAYSVFDWASPQPDGPRPLTMRSLPRPRR
ncbi:hypothetical protein AB0D59_01145 [Streptomyces sp. NPDC048417]|uniref:hypothetical protein n=1 Tax=Streptomyces sp. NPDC048417 TaxID=3155387 RepID=UPI00343B9D75